MCPSVRKSNETIQTLRETPQLQLHPLHPIGSPGFIASFTPLSLFQSPANVHLRHSVYFFPILSPPPPSSLISIIHYSGHSLH